MANLIQIKRSLNTATAPSLANGELAFTANGDHLFIGSNGAEGRPLIHKAVFFLG